MSLPKTISGWCMFLYFVVVGLSIIPVVGGLIPAILAPVFALGYVIFFLIGK